MKKRRITSEDTEKDAVQVDSSSSSSENENAETGENDDIDQSGKISEELPEQSEEENADESEETAETESERFMRLAAEFDNYKKRTAREFGDLIKTANSRLLRSLVEIVDNFERAIQSDNGNENTEGFKKGVELIYNQLKELLKKERVEPISAVGQPFNPNIHEAMLQQESDEHDEGIVIQEIQKGYQLDDKVLRHARVIVSSGKKEKDNKQSEK